jgi:hypothetical protein
LPPAAHCQDARVYTLPLLKHTVLLNWYFRAMGASIAPDAVLQTTELSGFDLISIGKGACLESLSCVGAITFTAAPPPEDEKDKERSRRRSSCAGSVVPVGGAPYGKMALKAVSIGADATIGPQCQVTSCTVPDGALVEPCTASSNPARKGGACGPKDPDAVRTGHAPLGAAPALLSAAAFTFMFSVCMCVPAVGESPWGQQGRLVDSTTYRQPPRLLNAAP